MTEDPTNDDARAADARAATADARMSTADSRVATADSRKATLTSRRQGKRNDRSAAIMIIASAALLASGGVGIYAQHQAAQLQRCVSSYISGAAPLANDVADASQRLWDDFSEAQTATTPRALRALRAKFFADLKTERAANDALKAYRAKNSPERVCP